MILNEVIRRYEETQDPLVRVMQRIVELCNKHRVELQGVRWEESSSFGANGGYQVLISSIALDAEAAFEMGLNKIGGKFDTAVVFTTP